MDSPLEEEAGVTEKIDLNPTDKSANRIFWTGVVLTSLWVFGLVVWWWDRANELTVLEANAFGDFLAGICAPVAFLWLVLGFWQQGQELRNSSSALWMQMRELQNSVKAQNDLVGATRSLRDVEREIADQNAIETDRAARPIFSITRAGGMTLSDSRDLYQYSFSIRNSGADAADVKIESGGRLLKSIGTLNRGASQPFKIVAAREEPVSHEISVSYYDARNIRREEAWNAFTGPGNTDEQPARAERDI